MHRIDGPGASNGLFSTGVPGGQMSTVVTSEWLNDTQENLARLIEAAGITLIKGDYDQLRQAINLMAGTGEIGEGKIWFSETLPASGDWMECDGTLLPKADYPALFDVWGYTFGGSGAAFRAPDLRGEFLRHRNNGSGRDPDTDIRTDRGDGVSGDRLGTRQTSALLDHPHEFYAMATGGGGSGPGGGGQVYNGVTWGTLGLLGTSEGGLFHSQPLAGFHRNQVSRYETRPRNVSVMFIYRWR